MRTFLTTTVTIYVLYNMVLGMADSLGWHALEMDRPERMANIPFDNSLYMTQPSVEDRLDPNGLRRR